MRDAQGDRSAVRFDVSHVLNRMPLTELRELVNEPLPKNSFLSHSESDSPRIYSYTAAIAEMISSERQNCMEPVSGKSFA